LTPTFSSPDATSPLLSFATPNSASSNSSIPITSDFLFLPIPLVFELLVVVVGGTDDVLDLWTGDSGGAGECPSFKNDDDVVCGPTFKSLYPLISPIPEIPSISKLISLVESMTLGLALNGMTAEEDEEGLAAFVIVVLVVDSELEVDELCGKKESKSKSVFSNPVGMDK